MTLSPPDRVTFGLKDRSASAINSRNVFCRVASEWTSATWSSTRSPLIINQTTEFITRVFFYYYYYYSLSERQTSSGALYLHRSCYYYKTWLQVIGRSRFYGWYSKKLCIFMFSVLNFDCIVGGNVGSGKTRHTSAFHRSCPRHSKPLTVLQPLSFVLVTHKAAFCSVK